MKGINYNTYYNLQETFDNLYNESKVGKTFNHLYEIITSRDNILLAYRNIKANTGSTTSGVDKIDINYFKTLTEEEFVIDIQKQFDNYKPNKVRRVYIPKSNGKLRPLGIPTMKDRIIQQCIYQVLEPICEAKFYKHSYGFRPNRSTEHAIARVSSLVNIAKMHYTVDIDIESFFDNVNHRILRKQIWNLGIHDKRIISIINKILKAPIENVGVPTKGTPQGGILSPLLSNIVLNDLDWWIASQWEEIPTNHTFSRNDAKYLSLRKSSNLKEGFIVRYADDFKILCKDYKSAEKWFYATKEWIEKRLKLNISLEKSKIVNMKKRKSEYLGFEFKAYKSYGKGEKGRDKGKFKYVVRTNVSQKNKKKIQENIKALLRNINKCPTRYNAYKYNIYIQGIHNYYMIATCVTSDFNELYYKLIKQYELKLKNRGQITNCDICNFKNHKYRLKRKTWVIQDTPLFPLTGVTFFTPSHFKQDISDFTLEGRRLSKKYTIEGQLKIALQYLSKNYILSRSLEYNDNRISKFSSQKGKCYITNADLVKELNSIHCHHKTPIYLGGTDKYSNLIIVHENAHRLIHATTLETIQKYMKLCNITTSEQLKRLNSLRKLCNLQPISL